MRVTLTQHQLEWYYEAQYYTGGHKFDSPEFRKEYALRRGVFQLGMKLLGSRSWGKVELPDIIVEAIAFELVKVFPFVSKRYHQRMRYMYGGELTSEQSRLYKLMDAYQKEVNTPGYTPDLTEEEAQMVLVMLAGWEGELDELIETVKAVLS